MKKRSIETYKIKHFIAKNYIQFNNCNGKVHEVKKIIWENFNFYGNY